MLREGIREGMIVTNSSIFPAARRSARDLQTKPVRLFSSTQLAGSMASLGLGVEKIGGRHGVADWFFRGLGQIQLGYSLDDKNVLLNRKRNRRMGQIPGPRLGDRWLDGIVWLVLVALLALVLASVLGGVR